MPNAPLMASTVLPSALDIMMKAHECHPRFFGEFEGGTLNFILRRLLRSGAAQTVIQYRDNVCYDALVSFELRIPSTRRGCSPI